MPRPSEINAPTFASLMGTLLNDLMGSRSSSCMSYPYRSKTMAAIPCLMYTTPGQDLLSVCVNFCSPPLSELASLSGYATYQAVAVIIWIDVEYNRSAYIFLR